MFVREGIHLFLRGVLLGLPLAAFVGAVLQRFLAGVSSFDPVSYGIAIVLFGGLALVACYLPSARAARTEPLTALRVG
jgi:ABC-type antimicrobial peptide transport system permease subunit